MEYLVCRASERMMSRRVAELDALSFDILSGTSSKALAAALHTVYSALLFLHAFPRSLVQLSVQSLSPSAITSPSLSQVIPFSARAAAINAATLAVLDNGSVGMKGTVFAVAIAVLRPRANHYQYSDIPVEENGTEETLFVLDPTPEEELQAKSRYIVGWSFGAGIPAVSSGAVPDDEDEEMDLQERPAEIKSECVHLESEGDFDAVTVSALLSCAVDGSVGWLKRSNSAPVPEGIYGESRSVQDNIRYRTERVRDAGREAQHHVDTTADRTTADRDSWPPCDWRSFTDRRCIL
jgi:hypothetical protein